jgi:hypothetical protein
MLETFGLLILEKWKEKDASPLESYYSHLVALKSLLLELVSFFLLSS